VGKIEETAAQLARNCQAWSLSTSKKKKDAEGRNLTGYPGSLNVSVGKSQGEIDEDLRKRKKPEEKGGGKLVEFSR